jgi:hypothetical protein
MQPFDEILSYWQCQLTSNNSAEWGCSWEANSCWAVEEILNVRVVLLVPSEEYATYLYSEPNNSIKYLRFSQLWLWRMLYSGMWRRVVLVFTDVSEQCITSIFRWLVPRSRIFYPEDGGDTFLRNVGSQKIYTRHFPENGILQINQVYTSTRFFFKILFNIILPPKPGKSSLFVSFVISNQNFFVLSFVFSSSHHPRSDMLTILGGE